MAEEEFEIPRTKEGIFRAALKHGLDGTDVEFQSLIVNQPAIWEMKDENDMTILHHAIKMHIEPARVEQLFLKAGHRAAFLASMRYGRVGGGMLPLNMVLEDKPWHKDAELASILLDVYPKAVQERDDVGNGSGWPLHKVLMKSPFQHGHVILVFKILRLWPQVIYQSVGGDLPLHKALDGSKPDPIVFSLLQAHLGAAAVPNSQGILPLHMAVFHQMPKENIRKLMEAYPPALTAPVKLHGGGSSIIEYAIRNKMPPDILNLLISGGETNEGPSNPRLLAYSRSVIFNLQPRPWRKVPDITGEQQKDKDNLRKSEQAIRSMGGIKLYLRIGNCEPQEVYLRPDATVDDLKQKVLEWDGVPLEEQKLMLLASDQEGSKTWGRRLMEGEMLWNYIDRWKAVKDTKRQAASSQEKSRRQGSDVQSAQGWSGTPTQGQAEDRKAPLAPTIRVDNMNLLVHLALRRSVKKESILKLLDIRPEFALEEDHLGMLPLHVALTERFDDPNGDVVLKLLTCYPASRLMLSGTTRGEYPLQSAIAQAVSEPIILKLLEDVQPSHWNPKTGSYIPTNPSEDDFYRVNIAFDVPLLHAAVVNNCSPKVVKELLDKGYPVHVRNYRDGHSALEYTLIYNSDQNNEVFDLILSYTSRSKFNFYQEKGTNGQSLMHLACRNGVPADRLRKLCDFGEHILQINDNDGRLPIHMAVTCGLAFDAVRELVTRYPESVHVPDSRGRTPMMLAVVSDPSPGVVFELARNIDDVGRVRDDRGRSLLHTAVLANAPFYVIHELLEAAPDLILEVNLIDGKWPANTAGQEVRRLALLPRRQLGMNSGMGGAMPSNTQRSKLAGSRSGVIDTPISERQRDSSYLEMIASPLIGMNSPMSTGFPSPGFPNEQEPQDNSTCNLS